MSKPSCLKDGKWHLLLLNQCPPPIISIFTAPVGSAIVKVILFCARFLMLTSNFLGELSIQVLNSIKTCNSCDWQAGFTFAVMKSYWLCMVGGLFFLLVALEVRLSHSFGHIGDLRLKRIWHIFQVSSAKHLQQRHEYWHFQTMLQHSHCQILWLTCV